MYFAAIDLGATYIKSCRIDENLGALERITRVRFPLFESNKDPSRRETSLVRIIEAVKQALAALELDENCVGLSVSNQMHGLVLMDGFEPLSNFLSWQDSRSASFLTEIRARLGGIDLVRETGEHLRAGFPLAQLYSLKKEGVSGGEVCDLGTAVIRILALDPAVGTSLSNAAATGVLNITQSEWHKDLINTAGLSAFKWPCILRGREAASKIAGIPVYAAVGDQQISLLGAGLSQTGHANFNIATGSQASSFEEKAETGTYQLRPFFGNYIRTVTHIPAGRALNRLMSLFVELSPALDLDTAWDSLGSRVDLDCNSVPALKVDLSFFDSAFGTRGGITEIHESELNVISVMRAAFESIAERHIEALKRLGSPIAEYKVFTGSGGILRKSAYLRSAFRRRLPKDLQLNVEVEDALRGHSQRMQSLLRMPTFAVNG